MPNLDNVPTGRSRIQKWTFDFTCTATNVPHVGGDISYYDYPWGNPFDVPGYTYPFAGSTVAIGTYGASEGFEHFPFYGYPDIEKYYFDGPVPAITGGAWFGISAYPDFPPIINPPDPFYTDDLSQPYIGFNIGNYISGSVPVAGFSPNGSITLEIPLTEYMSQTAHPNEGGDQGSHLTVWEQNDRRTAHVTASWNGQTFSGDIPWGLVPTYDLICGASCCAYLSSASASLTATLDGRGFGDGQPDVTRDYMGFGGSYVTGLPIKVGSWTASTGGATISTSCSGGLKEKFILTLPSGYKTVAYHQMSCSGYVDSWQSKKLSNVVGQIRCFDSLFPDPAQILVSGAGYAFTPVLSKDGAFSYTFDQSWSLGNPTGNTGTSIGNPYVIPDYQFMLDKGESGFTGYAGRAFHWPVLTLKRIPLVSIVPDKWTAGDGTTVSTSSGNVTATGPKNVTAIGVFNKGLNTEGFRYIQFNLAVQSGTVRQVVVRAGALAWVTPMTDSGMVELDLCFPTNARGVEQADTHWPESPHTWPDGTVGYAPAFTPVHWGLCYADKLEFEIDGVNLSVEIDGLQFVQKEDVTIECMPSQGALVPINGTDPLFVLGKRGFCALVDGRMSLEATQDGADFLRLPDFVAYINSVPGWAATLEDSGYWWNDNKLGGMRDLVPAYWDGKQWVDQSTITLKKSSSSLLGVVDAQVTLYSQIQYGSLDAHPAAGDVDSGKDYGLQSKPNVMRFLINTRGKAWGLASNTTEVEITNADGSPAGAGTVRKDGYFETGAPYAKGGNVCRVLADGADTGTVVGISSCKRARTSANSHAIGVALACGRVGYFLAKSSGVGLRILKAWKSDQSFSSDTEIDPSPLTREPRLAIRPFDELLTVVYRIGTTVFRAGSYDYGQTWKQDGNPYWAGFDDSATELTKAVTVPHYREVYNNRTKERIFFRMAKDGRIYVDIYSIDEKLVGTFPGVDDAIYDVVDDSATDTGSEGIGDLVADDASFDAIAVPGSDSAIDCVFAVAGVYRRFRSYDEARTWTEIPK